MDDAARTEGCKPTLHPAFVPNMVRTFNDSNEHGVHLLFNEWWAHAPEVTIQRYLENFRRIPGAEAFLAERHRPTPSPSQSSRSCRRARWDGGTTRS